MSYIGFRSLIALLSHIFFIGVAYQIIQIIRLDRIVKKGYPQQIKLLYLLLAISLGFLTSNFFLDFFSHTQNLLLLFQ